MQAIRLRAEYLKNPMGIDITCPRFFWQCDGGISQRAYRIVCENDGTVVWDSGKVTSDRMTHIEYAGRALVSRELVSWRVKLWDENGNEGDWSETATFEMGLLCSSDWKAKWISGSAKPEKDRRMPVDCFRKELTLRHGVKKARLYASACGLYEARIDGERVGEFELAPGSTDYRKRIQYQTYDVTPMLQDKEKATLSFLLADGWYRGSVGAYGLINAYGKTTSLIFQLEIQYENGKSEIIISDESTAWSNNGELRFADLKDGEIVDARMSPSYDGKAKLSRAKANLCASNNVIPKKQERLFAELIVTPGGKTVLDFGQNIAGYLSFRLNGKSGERIVFRFGEALDENGEFTQKNFQLDTPAHDIGKLKEMLVISGKAEKAAKALKKTPLQEVVYTCRDGENRYCTRFAVFGFRYVLAEGLVGIDPKDFTAIAVYSDMESAGSFSCSNEKVNRLYQNTFWSMKSNFLDVPTDCPTRERLGWTGDAQIFFNTGAYMMDVASFYRKYIRDMEAAQNKQGKIPAVMPYSRADMMYNVTGNSVGWADACVLIPYRYWKRYGDDRLLAACYPMMQSYANYMIRNTGHKSKKDAEKNPYNKYVYEKGFHLGEWLEPKEFQDDIVGGGTKLLHTEECTAYLHYTMSCMAEVAEALGKGEDETLYREYTDGAVKAYDFLYMNPCPDTDRQAKLVRPLALGVVKHEKEKACAERLVQAVKNRNYCVMTGFLSTPFILPVLTKHGHLDVAYRMLENEQAPGWLSEVNAGATTVWESWEGDASQNHYSPGAVCEWMFDTILGIRVEGRNHFVIAPQPGGTLTHAEGQYLSLYGTVKSAWEKREDGGTAYRIEIPANCSATVILDGETRDLTAGQYVFP